jgi:hypothetical protein
MDTPVMALMFISIILSTFKSAQFMLEYWLLARKVTLPFYGCITASPVSLEVIVTA